MFDGPRFWRFKCFGSQWLLVCWRGVGVSGCLSVHLSEHLKGKVSTCSESILAVKGQGRSSPCLVLLTNSTGLQMCSYYHLILTHLINPLWAILVWTAAHGWLCYYGNRTTSLPFSSWPKKTYKMFNFINPNSFGWPPTCSFLKTVSHAAMAMWLIGNQTTDTAGCGWLLTIFNRFSFSPNLWFWGL